MIIRLLRALVACLALLTLTIGVPVLLAMHGRSPLDGTGSGWDQIAELPIQAISDNMALGLLTIAAWVSWALFALNVASEITTSLVGSRLWRIPGGPFELTARRLVMAVTMSASLATSGGGRAATVPMLTTAVSAAPAPDLAPSQPSTDDHVPLVLVHSSETVTVPIGPGDGQPGALPVVVVAAGDSPWLLAERHLGSGVRWRELWDLNRGVPQPDGRAWITEDLIRPGWRFTFPADAVGVLAAPLPVPAPATPIPDDDPQAAPTPPPPDDEEAAPPPASEDSPATPTAPGHPGSQTPSTTQPPEPVTAPPTSAAPGASDPSTSGGTDTTDEHDDDSAGWPAPLLGVAGTLLAAGVVRELHRRRARQAASLPAGRERRSLRRVPVDRELAVRADEDSASRLDSALAHLAEHLGPRNSQDSPQPRVVQVAGERIDVLLDQPQPGAPAPWRPEASGLVWVLDANQEIPATAEDASPMPALVTVGTGDAAILVDLEAFGVVSLVGDPKGCDGLARSIITELSARNEGTVAVEIVGDLLGDEVTRLNGVRHTASWDDADTAPIGTSTRLLDTGGWPHTWAARASGRIYDGWAPTVWITRSTDDARYLDALDAIASHPGTGTAMVVVGTDPGHSLRIHVDAEGRFEIPELNLRGDVQALGQEIAGQLADLLEDADTPVEPGTDTSGDTGGETSAYAFDDGDDLVVIPLLCRTAGSADEPVESGRDDGAPPSDTLYLDPDFDILVRVCGPIRVDGVAEELPQRETAVATYVALNGQVDIDRIRDAVWAGAGVSLKRVRNVISTVRAVVGDAISFTPDHRLTTGPGLSTDLELIRRRLEHAKQRIDPYCEADVLRGALDLATGRVCTFPRSQRRCWTWIDLDGWNTHVEALVGSVASRLARVYLELGDGNGAVWAARQGTDALGRRDELTILEVRGYQHLGDEASARSTMRSHESYLNDLGIDEHDDELLELLDRYATPVHHKTRLQEPGGR